MSRAAYVDAAALFVDTVGQVGPTQWEQSGLGVWTIRDLVGHTSRALLTVEMYLAKPARQREVVLPLALILLRPCRTSRLACWHKYTPPPMKPW